MTSSIFVLVRHGFFDPLRDDIHNIRKNTFVNIRLFDASLDLRRFKKSSSNIISGRWCLPQSSYDMYRRLRRPQKSFADLTSSVIFVRINSRSDSRKNLRKTRQETMFPPSSVCSYMSWYFKTAALFRNPSVGTTSSTYSSTNLRRYDSLHLRIYS